MLSLRNILGAARSAIVYAYQEKLQGPNDCLICDEAHRLVEGRAPGFDTDIIEGVVNACNVAVFFYDKRQHISSDDYFTKDKLEKLCSERGIRLENVELKSQHRCIGADGFLMFVDQLLYSKERPEPFTLDGGYEVALARHPDELFELIRAENGSRGYGLTSRVLAGKGPWDWARDTLPDEDRRTITPLGEGTQPRYAWNLYKYGRDEIFATCDRAAEHVGSVDSCQGVDFACTGVIIAPDLIYDGENGVRVCPAEHLRRDDDVKGADPDEKDELIRNAYAVLLSRAEKKCLIYCCDRALHDYLAQFIRET